MVRPLADIEKEVILSAIMDTGSISRAAVKLEISRSRIHRLLKRHNLSLKTNQIIAEIKRQRPLL